MGTSKNRFFASFAPLAVKIVRV